MSGFLDSVGSVTFQLGFQISPIILTGGLAQSMVGGLLPMIAFTEAINFVAGIISSASLPTLDTAFAQFVPVPGGTLINNAIGNYPMANQQVAANAIIAQPLSISMRMICPARQGTSYAAKLGIMTALQRTLSQHNNQGGTYTIATPSFIYTNCVMTGMTDLGGGESKQPQVEWQLDFVQPLITLAQAQQSLNSLMGKISAGNPVAGSSWSGQGISTGAASSGALASTTGEAAFASAAPIPVTSSPLGPL